LISKDDRPAGGSRPSLLSTEQQGAADGRSVLGALDGKAAKPAKPGKAVNKPVQPGAAASPPKARRGLALWGALGVAVAVLAGGGLTWMASVPDDESVAAADPVVAAPRVSAPAAAPAGAAVTSDSDVSTAAILNDTGATRAPAEKLPSLKDMLSAPVAKAAPRGDALTQALERPSPKAAPAREQPEKPKAPPKEAKAEPKKKPAKEKPKAASPPSPDKDATVLAVLMAEVQPNSQVPRKSTPAQQLKNCRQYNAAGAEQCRARLCSNTARNEPECKARNKGKAASDS